MKNQTVQKSTSEKTNNVLFLKLGGSLITDKARPSTPRPKIIARLAREIADTHLENPDLSLILGHGSGSFGHFPAEKYQTRAGVETREAWQGFAEVWFQASRLNRIIVEALKEAGLFPIVFPPSAGALVKDGEITSWELTPMKNTLKAGLMPVVYGDSVYDEKRGGTILSTENVFKFLALHFKPTKILIAGIEAGVWESYPARNRIVPEITPDNYKKIIQSIRGSDATDVTGGMATKVGEMLHLTQEIKGLEVLIFSGEPKGSIQETLSGKNTQGTLIHSQVQ